MTSILRCVPALLALSPAVRAAVDFNSQIRPILESACVHCHGEKEQEGDFRIDLMGEAFKVIDGKAMVVAGKPAESRGYLTMILPADDDDVMPPRKDGPPLAAAQTALIKEWIAEGAKWPEGVTLSPKPRMVFATHIQPVFETACLSCHSPEKMKGDYEMSTRASAFKGGEIHGAGIVPFDPARSPVHTLMALAADDDDLMPPKKSGGPLSKEKIEQVRLWIEQGAVWPEGFPPLKPREAAQERPPNPDDLDLVRKIHALILATSKEQAEADMKPYENMVPRTGAKYTMQPIMGGEFLLGSPAGEPGRNGDEGPQVKAAIDPFWMGKYEITWNEYLPFQVTPDDRNKDGSKKTRNPADTPIDLVSSPTAPYTEMSFNMGQDTFPAIAMTEHSALKYCQWLSAQTGHFYRLPTEAEWEYACRAGTTTAYSFGDDPAQLGEYAWFLDNSDAGFSEGQYHRVGTRKPNPWGLHDMHGNVLEWVLDQYDAQGYSKFGPEASNPWAKPTTLWGHAVRGGSWMSKPSSVRSAARRASTSAWKDTDPQFPKSIWYLTDVKWLGFRLVRPLRVPSPEEMFYIWNCGRPEELARKLGSR